MIRRARARLAGALDRRIGAVDEHVGRVEDRLGAIETRLEALEAGIASQHGAVDRLAFAVGRVDALLRLHVADDPGNRRRLGAARAKAGHDAAWTDDEPLVSICIATHDRLPTLLERSIPSALAQTRAAIEGLVVGDAPPPHVAEAVTALGDPRVRFASTRRAGRTKIRSGSGRPRRRCPATRPTGSPAAAGCSTSTTTTSWCPTPSSGCSPGHATAGSRWPTAIFEAAPTGRPDRPARRLPAPLRAVRLAGGARPRGPAVLHPRAARVGARRAGDWYRMERMLRSGVRIGHLPEVTCRYSPVRRLGAGLGDGEQGVADAVDVLRAHGRMQRQRQRAGAERLRDPERRAREAGEPRHRVQRPEVRPRLDPVGPQGVRDRVAVPPTGRRTASASPGRPPAPPGASPLRPAARGSARRAPRAP